METLAQSVSTIAPTTTPAATIPLVCALAGNGTWLAYVLATAASSGGVMHQPLRALFVFSRLALYLRVDDPSILARGHRRWSLLLAYIATGSSVIGGFYHYANLLLHDATGQVTSAVFLALIETLAVLNSSEEQISEQEGVRPRGSL
ncbi:MAG TPA: hypothetical protein VEM60_05720 [Candidatus Dormibacteraeota bacterium]|nr:hypothetical protein [Candidatus Dormibacteraeota bacterium]